MRTPLARLIALCVLLAVLAACGSKGPLVMPSEEPAKADEPAAPEQPVQ
jgi:predicted small lipoprotein YifL